MGKAKDWTGKTFDGGAIVIQRVGTDKNNCANWELKCSCGDKFVNNSTQLQNNKRVLCKKCLINDWHRLDNLSGKTFGMIIVLDKHKRENNCIKWLCRCECGTEKYCIASSLKDGTTVSCGCYKNKITSQRQSKIDKHIGLSNTIMKNECKILTRDTPSSNGKNKRWKIVCYCGVEFTVHERSLVNDKVNGCHKCTRYRVKYKKKPKYNSKNERGNTADIVARNSFKRDGYACRICSKKGGKLNAHHMDGWNWAVDKRGETDNCVTLCAGKNSCHSDFHYFYGNGDNTKEQFEQYLLFKGYYKLLLEIRNV